MTFIRLAGLVSLLGLAGLVGFIQDVSEVQLFYPLEAPYGEFYLQFMK